MKITIKDQTPLCSEYKVIVVGSVGIEKVNFELDETWENLQVFACFKNSNLKEEYSQFLSNSSEAYIPWEVLTVPGTLFIGVLGMDGERIIKPTIWKEVAKIREGTSTDGVASEEHSETALEQVVALAQSVRDDADAGKFNGEKGEKGDKGDKGDQGIQGERGVSGVYVGSGDMPEGYNIQIDPTGDADLLSAEGVSF